jgi:hypothetical protein
MGQGVYINNTQVKFKGVKPSLLLAGNSKSIKCREPGPGYMVVKRDEYERSSLLTLSS